MLEKFHKRFGFNDTASLRSETAAIIAGPTYDETGYDPKLEFRRHIRRVLIGGFIFFTVLISLICLYFVPSDKYGNAEKKDLTSIIRFNAQALNPIKMFTKSEPTEKPKTVEKTAVTVRVPEKAAPVTQKMSSNAPEKINPVESKKVLKAIPVPQKTEKKTPKAAESTKKPTRPIVKITPENDPLRALTEIATGRIDAKDKTVDSVKASKKESQKAVKTTRYFIQVFASGNRTSAENRMKRIKKLGLPVYIETVRRQNSNLYRVRVGRYKDKTEAKRALSALMKNSISSTGIVAESVDQ